MNGLYSCVIAISMYSKVPMPHIQWTKERMGYVMCWFPVVGIFVGAALWGWQLVCGYFKISEGAAALAAAAIPILVTGGIHLDGFLDTMDAIHSYAEPERKLEILKDPHVGAFAVIGGGAYFLLYGAVMWETVKLGLLGLAVPVMVMERAFSGLSVVFFPCAKKSGLAATFSDGAKRRTAGICLSLWVLASAAAMTVLAPGTGGYYMAGGLLAVQLVVFLHYRRMSMKQFGGITGDLAGYFLQVCELASLCWLAAGAHMGLLGG